MTTPLRRIPVENLLVGDIVQAVDGGPRGRVIDVRGNWTLVQYHSRHEGGTMSYRHGETQLTLCSCAGSEYAPS